ncbi:hypothetical protein KNE206_17270 [Kitasatospora sp. NE20-6]|uniref:hypothetical protein n=1 Tax=Kitasatospora sp. NE20-6 TaxID=2859066 RepID=UPI0034DBA308
MTDRQRSGSRSGVTHIRTGHAGPKLGISEDLVLTTRSALAIGLAAYLTAVPEGTPVTIKALAQRFREGEISIAKALNVLVDEGWLVRSTSRLDNGRVFTRTLLHDAPVGRTCRAPAQAPPSPVPPALGPTAAPAAVPPVGPPSAPVTAPSWRSWKMRTRTRRREGGAPRPLAPPAADPAPPPPAAACCAAHEAPAAQAVQAAPAAQAAQAVPAAAAPAAQAAPEVQPVPAAAPGRRPAPPRPPGKPEPPTAAGTAGRPPRTTRTTVQPAASTAPFGPPAAADDGPVDPQAFLILASLHQQDSRLLLSEGEIRRLAPSVGTWLSRAATPQQIIMAVTDGLPAEFSHRPARMLGYRLRTLMPPEPPPPGTVRTSPVFEMQNCTGCDRGFRAPVPRLCGECVEEQNLAAAA